MNKMFCRSMLGLLTFGILLVGEAYAETFEFLRYTPPPGWTNQTSPDRTTYQRQSGIGMITLYLSYPSTRSASEEFAEMWRARLEPTLPVGPPQPETQRDGDYTIAVGTQVINAQGTITTIVLAAIVGRGRAMCVLSMSAGDDVLREVTAFFDSLRVTLMNANAKSNSNSASVTEIEVDFEAPRGYTSKREGKAIVLTPTSLNDTTPCIYGISASRPSKGRLELDAREAILEVLPGWQLKSDHYNAMRGTAGDGWNYFWFRTDVQSLVGGSYQYATAMTTAFPASSGRVNIVWGAGDPARCLLDDLAFAQLFHSLRPRGWQSDGGRALAKELQGTWRNSQRLGIAQYKFLDNGRYEFGIGSITQTGLLERTSSSVLDGRYLLRGAELILTPDRRERGVSRYRIRIYDEFVAGRWTRALSLLDESASPALDVQYMKVNDSR